MSTVFLYPTYRAISYLVQNLFPDETWTLTMLGGGAVSVAWQATSASQSLVIRATPPDSHKQTSYAQEFAITQLLFDAAYPVPEPIASSVGEKALHIANIAFDWAITRFINGKPIHNKSLTKENAQQLGQILAYLHGIPVQGYGNLQITDRDFVANQDNALAGAAQHWGAYPMWGVHETVRLESTVIATMFPDYLPILTALEDQVKHAASQGEPVICHADLHSEHIFLDDERLSAVIDFGDSCLLPAAWDFAIAARYYGWRAVDDMLSTYTDSEIKRNSIRHQAYELGLIIGVFKLQRQFLRHANVVVRARTLQFINHTLKRINLPL